MPKKDAEPLWLDPHNATVPIWVALAAVGAEELGYPAFEVAFMPGHELLVKMPMCKTLHLVKIYVIQDNEACSRELWRFIRSVMKTAEPPPTIRP